RDPPPPYSFHDVNSPSNPIGENIVSTDGSKYAFLQQFDMYIVIDNSDSMQGPLWEEAKEVLREIVSIHTTYNPYDLEIRFLNHDATYRVSSVSEVEKFLSLVKPNGRTYIAKSVYSISLPYFDMCMGNLGDIKPINIVIITGSKATDDVQEAIVDSAQDIRRYNAPSYQFGLHCFQVGNDIKASKHLKRLNKKLREKSEGGSEMGIIVNIVPSTEENKLLHAKTVLEVVIDSFDKRLEMSNPPEEIVS
ncbi:hypothetical protein BS50DRAFT_510236, partial [Corynespora cassiicola Philippines]